MLPAVVWRLWLCDAVRRPWSDVGARSCSLNTTTGDCSEATTAATAAPRCDGC